ncbi:MAG: methyltransferase domain-containing protein [Candidatus Dormibacteraeota bacterium]|nr:methyltransferase domain-containing protein [Candidatus Dormibacteraeota bacterium]
MSTIDTTTAADKDAWRSDFFGTVNEMPPDPVGLIAGVLEAMATEPGFQAARQALIQDLGLASGGSVAEAGCGTGTSLPDLLSALGSGGTIVGVDPSRPFLDRARERASKAGAGATYQEGDARQLPLADATYDAAFCDKILIHVSPPSRVLSEMARVTKPGGKVGALEWMPRFAISTTDPELADRYNDIYRLAVCDYYAAANLERHMHQAGLVDVAARTYVAHATSLDQHPFWRLFLLAQIPLFAHAGLISEEDGQRFAADQEELSRRGEFSAAFIIRTAVGNRPA